MSAFTPPDPTDPQDTANAAGGALEFRTLKAYLDAWIGVMFDPTTGLFLSSTVLPISALPAFVGDATSVAQSNALTVKKINGVTLSGLATGVLVNITSTGAPRIAISSDTFPGNSATATASTTQAATDNSTNIATTAYVSRVAKQGQFLGTATNDAATAGNVGQNITATLAIGSAINIPNASNTAVLSVSLTAGDWDVAGNINFAGASATITSKVGAIGLGATTILTDGTEVYSGIQTTASSGTDSLTITPKRVSLAATTTVYIIGNVAFSAGMVTAWGFLSARRVR